MDEFHKTKHDDLDYLGFSNYIPDFNVDKFPEKDRQHAAHFHLVYDFTKDNESFALRFINHEFKTRWLCFMPVPRYMSRQESGLERQEKFTGSYSLKPICIHPYFDIVF